MIKEFKIIIKPIMILLLILFSLSFINSTCFDTPTYIYIFSGSNNLGIYDNNFAYIKADINLNPIIVKFYFENIADDCFQANDDIRMKILSTGAFLSANSISTEGNFTVAQITFQLSTTLPQSFTSTYEIKNKNNPTGKQGVINFAIDDEAPTISLSSTPTNSLVKPSTDIRIDFELKDMKSGLDNLLITGGASELINFNGNKTYNGFITDTITSSKTYIFTAKDLLGNEIKKNMSFIVDGTPPQITDFKIKKYSNTNNIRTVSFSAEITDDSFEMVNTLPIFYGNFSEINPAESKKNAVCSKSLSNPKKYNCNFDNIAITTLTKTSSANIKLVVKDSLDNIQENTYAQKITYDTQGPEIIYFYLENYIGEKNIFNAHDNETKVYLKFKDESLNLITDVRINPDFDSIFYLNPNCKKISDYGECTWELRNSLTKYGGEKNGNVTFKITLIDIYGNSNTKSINITYNNIIPKITDIELIEVDYSTNAAIKTGVISSGDTINFRIYIEKNGILELNENGFIYADFSAIDFKDGMDNKTTNTCIQNYNETHVRCEFNNIIVANGYMKKNITFIVIDKAGNIGSEKYEVEIFSRGDEVFSSFKIPQITITNPLNRNLVLESGATAWFEGETHLENGEDIKVINYVLSSCNDSQINPILLGSRNLFPNEVVVVDKKENFPLNFVLKMDIKHSNVYDLNEKVMKCTMSILKRDNEKIYPEELVEFNVKFEFFDLPGSRDTLLKANAQNILEMIDDADFLGSTFDSIYGIYEIFNKGCSVVNTLNQIISTVNLAWVPISFVLDKIPVTKAFAYAGDQALIPADGIISNILNSGIVKKTCDFVTCRNGGLLGNFWANTDVGKSYTNTVESIGGGISNICTIDSDQGGEGK